MSPNPQLVLNANDIKKAEIEAVEAGDTYEGLMEKAGSHVFVEMHESLKPSPTLVICGPGNNGGDGYVVARLLKAAGWEAEVAADKACKAEVSPECQKNKDLWDGVVVDLADVKLSKYAIIVDSLFGTGLQRPVEGKYATLVNAINDADLQVVSIDLPSGIHSDTGEVMGCAVEAELTITFDYYKPGHLLLPGRQNCGKTVLRSIGLADVDSSLEGVGVINAPDLWQESLSLPKAAEHKYHRGYLAIIAGEQMTGAPRLAAAAARRIGAGLVTIICPRKIENIYKLAAPGVIVRGFETFEDFQGAISDSKISTFLVGPGLPSDDKSLLEVIEVLHQGKATVLDAGALTVFAQKPDDLKKYLSGKCILTPHEGEFQRVFSDLSGSKVDRASEVSEQTSATIVLKGADTVISAPGKQMVYQGEVPAYLATAGTGDVLAGLVAGLLAQTDNTYASSCAGAWFLGEAANRIGVGLIAEDIPERVPEILHELLEPLQEEASED